MGRNIFGLNIFTHDWIERIKYPFMIKNKYLIYSTEVLKYWQPQLTNTLDSGIEFASLATTLFQILTEHTPDLVVLLWWRWLLPGSTRRRHRAGQRSRCQSLLLQLLQARAETLLMVGVVTEEDHDAACRSLSDDSSVADGTVRVLGHSQSMALTTKEPTG
jgi:hypothetical protein